MDLTSQLESQRLEIEHLKYLMSRMEHYVQYMGKWTRNSLSTVSAIILALVINLSLNILHEHYPIPLYGSLLEQEQILATDAGIHIRELVEYDTSRFIVVPDQAVMIGLSPAQTAQYLQTVIKTESSFNQKIINWAGYMGIGQYGAAALVQVGLVDRAKFNAARKAGILRGRDGWIGQKQWLANPSNWLLPNGRETFLNSRDIQIAAIVRLANLNIQAGYRYGALHKTDSAKKHAGFAKAAHLVGTFKASLWYKYRIDSQDGNKTRASTYARQGENSISLF